MRHVNPSLDAIATLLRQARTVAVVGYSPDPRRPSHRIAHALAGVGYRVIAVRPDLSEALGGAAYPRLTDIADVGATIDIVDVFRAPAYVPAIVDECLALGLKTLWLQDGVVHEGAAERGRSGGMTVVMDRCIGRDYRALVGAVR